MKRELLVIAAALLLLTGCSAKNDMPAWPNELQLTRPEGEVREETAIKPVRDRGTLEQGVVYSISVDGELTLTGADITRSLMDEVLLKDKWDTISCVVFGEGVTRIGRECARNLGTKNLKVIIGDTVTTIEDRAFFGSEKISSVQMGTALKEIGSYAFSGCTQLASLRLPDGLLSIGDNAFDGCTALRELSLPASVTQIGRRAFSGDSNINGVELRDRSYRQLWESLDQPASNWYDWRENSSITREICLNGAASDWKEVQKKGVLDGGAEFILYADGGLTVSGADVRMPLKDDPALSGKTDTITYVTFGSGVSIIGDNACAGMTAVKNVVIEEGVTCIDNNAFQNCTGLTSITLPASVGTIGRKAFDGDAQITQVLVQGRNCTQMMQDLDPGKSAWYNWREGSAITKDVCKSEIPDPAGTDSRIWDVVKKGTLNSGLQGEISYVLYSDKELLLTGGAVSEPLKNASELQNDWDKITIITFGEGVSSICQEAAKGLKIAEIRIGDQVELIGDRAFEDCKQLETVKLGKALKEIGSSAFENCDALGSVEAGDALEIVGSRAFANCKLLSRAELGTSVRSIGDDAFRSCVELKRVVWGSAVTDIGSAAFMNCTTLNQISTLGKNIDHMGKQVFSGCTALTEVTIACSVSISAFEGCTSIRSLNFEPGTTTSIDSYAFKGCTGLISVTLPDGLVSLATGAFSRCTAMTDITLPETLVRIGRYAFEGDEAVRQVWLVGRDSINNQQSGEGGVWYGWNDDIIDARVQRKKGT